MRKLYPQARVYGGMLIAWSHHGAPPAGYHGKLRLRRDRGNIVCVSDFQRRGVSPALRSIGLQDGVRADHLTRWGERCRRAMPVIDPDTIVYFSSPTGGLKKLALDVFV